MNNLLLNFITKNCFRNPQIIFPLIYFKWFLIDETNFPEYQATIWNKTYN